MATFEKFVAMTINGVVFVVPMFVIDSASDTVLYGPDDSVVFNTLIARFEGQSGSCVEPGTYTVSPGYTVEVTNSSYRVRTPTTNFLLNSINTLASESIDRVAIGHDTVNDLYYISVSSLTNRIMFMYTSFQCILPTLGSQGRVTWIMERGDSLYASWSSIPNDVMENVFKEYTPTPPDTDPYSGVDGEGALPGGADVDLPAEPTLSALDAGMFALFAPSSSQMKSLASYLWTDFGGAGTDVVAMLGEVVEALKRTVANPLELVLGLSIIASQGLSKGGSSNVHVGFWDTGVSMTKLAKQYFTVDCGSITFNPVCGDTFLDYAPYSKFSIFLPYVGTKILDANDVVGHTISVKYRGDCVTGGLVCYLKRDGTIIAEFAGNCALNLPLSADSWGQTISGGLSIVAGAAGGAIKGGAAGAAAGAVASAASVATNPSVLSPQVEYTGAVAGGSGHMGSQKPFILREAVRFHSTSHFNTVTGYPSFYYRKLGDCTGFTQVVDVHMDGLSATGDELTEIESLLKGGVIL